MLLVMICWWNLSAQKADTIGYDGIVRVIYLDSFVVTAQQKGFSTEEFIQLVQEDKSFYQAFRNLRFVNYVADNEIRFYDKKGREKTYYFSKTRQNSDGRCRSMEVLEKKNRGKIL